MKRLGEALLWVIGLYFIARAVAEPFLINLNDPATYHLDWGGPHLAGVLAVHMGPGLIALALMITRIRSRSKPAARTHQPTL